MNSAPKFSTPHQDSLKSHLALYLLLSFPLPAVVEWNSELEAQKVKMRGVDKNNLLERVMG